MDFIDIRHNLAWIARSNKYETWVFRFGFQSTFVRKYRARSDDGSIMVVWGMDFEQYLVLLDGIEQPQR